MHGGNREGSTPIYSHAWRTGYGWFYPLFTYLSLFSEPCTNLCDNGKYSHRYLLVTRARRTADLSSQWDSCQEEELRQAHGEAGGWWFCAHRACEFTARCTGLQRRPPEAWMKLVPGSCSEPEQAHLLSQLPSLCG